MCMACTCQQQNTCERNTSGSPRAVLERHCAQSERPSTTTSQDPNHRHAPNPRQTKHLAGRTATSVSSSSWQCGCFRETACSSRLSLVRRSQQTEQHQDKVTREHGAQQTTCMHSHQSPRQTRDEAHRTKHPWPCSCTRTPQTLTQHPCFPSCSSAASYAPTPGDHAGCSCPDTSRWRSSQQP